MSEQNERVHPQWGVDEIRRLFEPAAVTVVGASARGTASRNLVAGLTREGFAFEGPIHLVNRRAVTLDGRSSVADVADVPGELGLVYLLLGADAGLDWLQALGDRPVAGVVVYAGGFAEAGEQGKDDALRDWAVRHHTPVLGPQSLGPFNPAARFLGMFGRMPETPLAGPIGLLCQSGGLSSGVARTILQRGLGIGTAVSYGNGGIVSFTDLGRAVLADPAIRCLLVHAESVPDVRALRALGREAHRAGKAVLLTLAGASEIGRRGAQSHTAAVATPRRLVEGVCEQAGILWVDDVDDLIDGAEALLQAGLPARPAGGIGVFAGSGGGAIVLADALGAAGVALPQPGPETGAALRELGFTGTVANPLDVGAGLLDHPDVYEAQLRAYVADERYGILCKLIGSSPPARSMPGQFAQYAQFVEVVQEHRKIPFLATPVAQSVPDVVTWEGAPWGAGARRVATKLKALQAWCDARAPLGDGPFWDGPDVGDTVRLVPAPDESTEVITGPAALSRLPALPVDLPDLRLITSADDRSELREVELPVVLKAEAGLEHRAAVGAVVGPLRTDQQVDASFDYVVSRWGCPVSVTGFVAHDAEAEVLLGIGVLDGVGIVSSVGRGGVGAGADLHLFSGPLSRRECELQVHRALGRPDDRIVALLHAMQELPEKVPGLRSLEFNPVVIDGAGRLVALDVKLIITEVDGVES